MTLTNLRHNLDEEKEIITELIILTSQMDFRSGRDRELISRTISSLTGLLKIINNSIPSLVESISPVKKLGKIESVKDLVNIKYIRGGVEKSIAINEAERKRFLQELNLSDFSMKRLRRQEKEGIISREFKKPSVYAKLSNRFFSKMSNNLIEKGKFTKIEKDLKKANIPFILNTYVSIILFSTALASLFSLVLFVFLSLFSISLDSPHIQAAVLSLTGILTKLAICIALPVITFFTIYFYPMLEAGSIGKKIDQELPFVTLHMSAVAGSGIEPTQIFKIIALGREYPQTKQELKKIINQVNIYGYDLVSALKNSAKSTSSQKLAELFNGLATTISGGGSLTEFLEKRTETLLFDYKLEREKSTKTTETFMNIYISVVIAAPMIMMILMILLSVGPISIGLGAGQLTIIIVSVVALINIVFLGVLQIKQPVY